MQTDKEGQAPKDKAQEAKVQIARERRAFLKLAGTGAATAGVAVVLGGGAADGAAPAAEARRDAGYSETAHVKKFYQTARF